MGLGTAAAMESSDAILTNDDLSALPRVMRICKRTLRTAKGNMWFALIIKLSVLILGIFGMATMAMAVFADVGVTLLSLLFASTILKAK